MIGRAGIGVDNVDIPAATAKGIIVMNTPFGNSITTAEHAITLMLALARQIPQADASTQAGKWEKNRFMGVEITGKTLGVIGAGNIGSIVVDRALGLRMRVIAYDPFLSPERAADIGVHKVELDELFRRADFITLHTPLTEKTKNIIDAAAFAKMKKGVRIINCARGGLVDEHALRAALDSGHVAGAAFDVFTEEPANGQSAVRPSQRRLHAASRRRHHRGAGERRAAGRRADVGLSVAGRDLERGEFSLDHRRGGAAAEALHRARREARLVRRAADRDRHPARCRSSYEGHVAQMKVKALTSAALAGLLRPMLQDVNVVSAPVVAKERGIVIEEMTREGHCDYESLITVTLETERGPRGVSGTVFADGRPRIVNIKGIRMDAEFGPSMIYITNLDKPGFIGTFSVDARRGRHQHRDLPCRPRGAGRQRDRADRDRRRASRPRCWPRCARCRRCSRRGR